MGFHPFHCGERLPNGVPYTACQSIRPTPPERSLQVDGLADRLGESQGERTVIVLNRLRGSWRSGLPEKAPG